MAEAHGTIVKGRWAGTRAALICKCGTFAIVRPFNDTAKTEDARIHLSPRWAITIPMECFTEDECPT
jgi:hypothetical protein